MRQMTWQACLVARSFGSEARAAERAVSRIWTALNEGAQMAWHLIRRRSAFLAAILTTMTCLTLLSPAGAATQRKFERGGSGVVTTYGVGGLHFEVANAAAVRAFAGRPDSVVYWNSQGIPTTRPSNAVWEIFQYGSDSGSYATYSFHHTDGRWLFAQFDTNRKDFRTARGTRVGMTYAEAKTQERGAQYIAGCVDAGFWRFRDGNRYALVVGVNPGQRVHALHAWGPGQLLC
jgi:hypothetical protein